MLNEKSVHFQVRLNIKNRGLEFVHHGLHLQCFDHIFSNLYSPLIFQPDSLVLVCQVGKEAEPVDTLELGFLLSLRIIDICFIGEDVVISVFLQQDL